MNQNTYTQYGENLLMISGEDTLSGKFIQLYRKPSELLFEWTAFNGVAYSEVYWDIRLEKNIKTHWTEKEPEVTEEEVLAFIKRTYTKELEPVIIKINENTEPTHN